MVRRQGLRLISRRCCFIDHLPTDFSLMALTRQMPIAYFHGLNHELKHQNEQCRLPKKIYFDSLGLLDNNSRKALRLKSCFNAHDGNFKRMDGEVGKIHAFASYSKSVRHSDISLTDKINNESSVNGHDLSKNGRLLGYSYNSGSKKLVVAVDVDEVLGSFLSALNRFISDRYFSNHSLSEYYVYEFFKIWNCSRAEADLRVHEFFQTDYFKNGIHPIPGAWHTLHKLAPFCELSVVTSRQNVIRDHTVEWLNKHYPGLFHDVHFGNHFALRGKSRPKSEICRSFGAQVLIDDNPRYALECADVGINVLLFDYDNSYPWSKSSNTDSHPLITKVHNWQEVEQRMFSWIPS